MKLRENVPLSTLTTLKAGGEARYVAVCESDADVREAAAFARERSLPFYALGEGSNVLASDRGYEGVVILVRIGGLSVEEDDGNALLTAGAGVSWDDVVRAAADIPAWGIENLAGVPGTMGAAPVQNIGAYGADLSQVLASVEAYDAAKDETRVLSREECELGYRDSRFKREPHLVILRVSLSLPLAGEPQLSYSDLARARDAGADLSTPGKIGDAVRAIRAKKFPDLERYGTAGSFFKNPVMSEEAYAGLAAKYGDAPRFPHPRGVKVPLAFILDKALSMRGFRLGRAWLFGAQPLVLVLDEGGNAADVEALAREVEKRVEDATSIRIEREVRSMPEK